MIFHRENISIKDNFAEANLPKHPNQSIIQIFIKELLKNPLFYVTLTLMLSDKLILDCYSIQGFSMEPNIKNGDRVFVFNKFLLNLPFFDINRGDVLIVDIGKENPLIKRVVGLPGENIVIKDNNIIIEGHKLVEPYVDSIDFEGESMSYSLKKDEYFIIGDARSDSIDSRTFGPVSLSQIEAISVRSYHTQGECYLGEVILANASH